MNTVHRYMPAYAIYRTRESAGRHGCTCGHFYPRVPHGPELDAAIRQHEEEARRGEAE